MSPQDSLKEGGDECNTDFKEPNGVDNDSLPKTSNSRKPFGSSSRGRLTHDIAQQVEEQGRYDEDG